MYNEEDYIKLEILYNKKKYANTINISDDPIQCIKLNLKEKLQKSLEILSYNILRAIKD